MDEKIGRKNMFLTDKIARMCGRAILSHNLRQLTKIFRFESLDKNSKDYLDRNDLRAIPEFAVNPLSERIIDLFIPSHEQPQAKV